MSSISKMADGAEKVRKELERALMAREDNIEQLENKLKVGGGGWLQSLFMNNTAALTTSYRERLTKNA